MADNEFEGKVALITGGATGIGWALSQALAKQGVRVALASRNEENLEQALNSLKQEGAQALAVPCNIKEADQVEKMVDQVEEKLGPIDFLINNAGANFLAPAVNISPNGWRAVVDVVLQGTYFVTRAVGLKMLERRGGRIIMMAATNGDNGSPLMAHSGAAKAGIINLAETLAVEWAPKITINCISPGPVRTDGADERLWADEESKKTMERTIPLGRIADTEDIVGPTLFLLSDAASYITGANLIVDGGQRLRQPPAM